MANEAVNHLEIAAQLIRVLPSPLLLVDSEGAIRGVSETFERMVECTVAGLHRRSLQSCCPKLSSDDWSTCIRRGGTFLVPWQLGREEILVAELLSADFCGAALILLSRPGDPRGAGPARHSSLEAVGTLVGSVAHDLNNILTSVLGHVSLLRLSLIDSPADRGSLRAVEDGTRRAAAIAQQILEVTRAGAHSPPAVEVKAVVTGALNLIQTSIPENIQLRYSPNGEPLFVAADENNLTQLIMNVALNARDALPRGGHIDVEVLPHHVSETVLVRGTELPPGLYALIGVRDTGDGIPPELLQKIFEPFFTTKAEKGTGLGLAICASLLRSLGGAIDVTSRLGVGTEFRLFLPAGYGEAVEVTSEAAASVEIATGSEHILVVDDEEAVRTIVQRSLEHLGYQVTVAQNGKEGLETYAASPDTYDLVIIDMIMPQLAGDELFRKLKEVNPGVPVLVASGFSSDARTRSILDNGGLGYIQKPFAVEELAQEVRRCLDLGSARKG